MSYRKVTQYHVFKADNLPELVEKVRQAIVYASLQPLGGVATCSQVGGKPEYLQTMVGRAYA